MSKRFFRLFTGAFLLCISFSVWAQIIHWEIDGAYRISTEIIREVNGGFDFNSQNSGFSNITLAITSTDPGCFECFGYAGADGELVSDATSGAAFTKRTDYEPPVYRIDTLCIYEGEVLHAPFDLTQPGVYNSLDMIQTIYVYLGDPFDPDISIYDPCIHCASAIGTLVPIPEPESYAMLLAGIGLLSFRARRTKTRASLLH